MALGLVGGSVEVKPGALVCVLTGLGENSGC